MKKVFFLTVFLLFQTLQAQTNLDFFIQSALKNNPQIKENNQSFLNSKLELDLIHAENTLPKLSLTANYVFVPYFNNRGKLVSSEPQPDAIGYEPAITDGGLYSALFNVEKNLFNGITIDALRKQVSVKDDVTRNNSLLLKHDIEKQVTDQYLQAYLSMKLIDLENEVLSLLKEEFSVSGKLKESGLIKESDNLLLSIEVENQTNALNSARSQFNTNINQLLTLCGIDNLAVSKIDSIALNLTPLQNNSVYARKYELDSLSLHVQQEILESKYNPQISAFFNTGLMAVSLEGIERKLGMSAGFNFTLPIYDGGQKSITRQQNEISIKSISYYREYFFNQLKNLRSNSISRQVSIKRNIENIQKQIKTYEKVMNISEKEFRQGLLSVVDYLTITKNFIELKKNLISSQNECQLEISNYNYWNW